MLRIKKYFLFLLSFLFCQKSSFAQKPGPIKRCQIINGFHFKNFYQIKLSTVIFLLPAFLLCQAIFSQSKKNAIDTLLGTLRKGQEVTDFSQIQKSDIDIILVILKKQKEDSNTVNIFNELSWHYRNLGNYEWGVKYADSALILAKRLRYKEGEALGYARLGVCNRETGNFSEALKCHFESLKISEQIGDKFLIAYCYNNIGNAYADQENFSEALRNHFYSLELKKTFDPPEITNIPNTNIPYSITDDISNTYNNIGEIFFKQKKYSEALTYNKAALEIRMKEWGPHPESFTNIGNVYKELKKYPEALQSYFTALKYLDKTGFKRGEAICHINIGRIIIEQLASGSTSKKGKQANEAFYHINKGLLLAKETRVKEPILLGYKGYCELYSYMKNYKKSMEYWQLYSEMKDSIFNYNTALKLEQFKTQYEVGKAVAEEKSKQEKLLAEQKAERKRKNELMIIGFGAFILLLLFIILLIRQRNQKRRAVEKAETGHKMAELELQSLRAQLNPHFMFNSLNAIQDLILKEDNDRSHLYLSRFSKLLRLLLDNANQPFVSVKQEMEFLELYLSLENLRIPDLTVSIEKDPKVNMEERMIPNMMLQPYIENAIWHGLSNKKGERKLYIRLKESGNAIEFQIEDNGVGRKKAAEIKSLYKKGHTSKGMELLSKRFELLSKEYGAAIQTTVTDLGNGEATGTLVKIDVPFTLSEQAKQLVHDTNHNN